MKKSTGVVVSLLAIVGASGYAVQDLRPREQAAIDEPFVGVTTDGDVLPGLYSIRATGVSTEPIREAAVAFMASLSAEQKAETSFAANDIEWRRWHNVHRAPRRGISFGEMDEAQRSKAYAMFRESLSAKGLEKTRNVMKLNEHLAELVGKHGEYGEEFYFITVMGEPSTGEPWGWQLDGHHLVFNFVVLGDQVVMSPAFMGSEPVTGSGAFAGIEVMQDEQDKGLALMESLDADQQARAQIAGDKTRGNALAQAFNDNLVLDYQGLVAKDMTPAQRKALFAVIGEYIYNMNESHAAIRMRQIEEHVDDTYFAWIGTTGEDAVFYYRIQSPVILIEFDHQGPIALDGPKLASRRHVHSVVRTPNGNDYGKDLLRQHYARHSNDAAHGHD